MRWVHIAVIALFAIAVLIFVVQNREIVTMSFLGLNARLPLAVLAVIVYVLGMLTGGGLLVWASGALGWSGLFNAMGVLMLGVLAMTFFMREPPSAVPEGAPVANLSFGDLLGRLRSAWQQPAAAALISVVMTYKLGETLADAMWKPMLFDRGFAAADIGLWNGTFGMLASLLGSTCRPAPVTSSQRDIQPRSRRRCHLPVDFLLTLRLRHLAVCFSRERPHQTERFLA